MEFEFLGNDIASGNRRRRVDGAPDAMLTHLRQPQYLRAFTGIEQRGDCLHISLGKLVSTRIAEKYGHRGDRSPCIRHRRLPIESELFNISES